MKKTEIINRLNELYKIVKMSPAEYAEFINNEHPTIQVKIEDAYSHRTGWIEAEIKWILNENKK